MKFFALALLFGALANAVAIDMDVEAREVDVAEKAGGNKHGKGALCSGGASAQCCPVSAAGVIGQCTNVPRKVNTIKQFRAACVAESAVAYCCHANGFGVGVNCTPP